MPLWVAKAEGREGKEGLLEGVYRTGGAEVRRCAKGTRSPRRVPTHQSFLRGGRSKIEVDIEILREVDLLLRANQLYPENLEEP